MEDWNGKERRSLMFDKEFYDKMMEVHGDLKYMKLWTESHDSADDERFKDANIKIDFISKMIWLGIGGLAVFQFFLYSFLK